MYPRKLAKSTKNTQCNLLKQQLDRGENCWYYNARAFVSTVSSFITTIVKEAVVPMIYTVTLNPALDKTVEIPNLALDTVNRITKMRTDPGGKGINVSKVIAKLGGTSKAIGILAGVFFLKRGYSLKRTYVQTKLDGVIFPVIQVVVFILLVALIFIMKAFGACFRVRPASGRKVDAQPMISEEEIAAIATALKIYKGALHDRESEVLTILNIKRAYSPWNSKIHGLTQLPDRR